MLSMRFDDGNRKGFIKISQRQFADRYKVIQSLGKGNFGDVLKARSNHGNIVALKCFKTQAIQMFHMISREVQNLKKMDHPNILKFYDCYVVDDYKYYMVTEYCPGGSLVDFASSITQERQKLLLCKQMAEGIAYAHSQGIVHRDLKPENIFIGQRNIAKIGDFGCSTRYEEKAEVLTSKVGSPAYMDPRVGKFGYDNTVDLYSLGMVFLWMFEGKGIYDECRNMTELSMQQSQIGRDYQNSIQIYIERLPNPIDAIVKNLLSPEHRYRFSAEKVAAMIQARLSQDKSSTNLISTLDELQESVESERVIFAQRLMALNKDFDRRYSCLKTRDTLYRLLKENQQALEGLKCIQGLRYVNADTKAQYTFLLLLQYLHWLGQMELLLKGEPSLLTKRYQIDPAVIEIEAIEIAEKHIERQRQRAGFALGKCAQRIQGTLHLISRDKYIPPNFREFVKAANQRDPLPFSLLSENDLQQHLKEFFQRRVKADYDYSRGSEEEHDDRLKVVEGLGRSFK